jgi:hypothetical protein
MNDDSLKAGRRFDVAFKMLKTETNPNPLNTIKAKRNKASADENTNKANQEQDNFDFLMELYD